MLCRNLKILEAQHVLRTADLGFQQYSFPPATSTRTLLLLHGTGGDENDLLDSRRQSRSRCQPVQPAR